MARNPADDLRILRRFAAWTATLPRDIDVAWGLVQNEAIANPGRRALLTGLSYLLLQFDLIPDHEKIGAVDDALVLRVAYGLAAEDVKKAGAEVADFLADDLIIAEFLGDVLHKKLRAYVEALVQKPIRGRTAAQLLDNAEARGDLRRELDLSLKQLPPPLVVEEGKASDLAVSILGYLKLKLP